MLPESLRRQLAYYAQPFGGLQFLESELPEDKLADIILHNGPILLVNPFLNSFTDDGSQPFDLTPYGFTPGAAYIVYDEDNNYRYRRFSPKGFGDHPLDRKLVRNTPHGHYFQVIFNAPLPRRVLFWVYNRPSEKDIQKRVVEARRVRDLIKFTPENELILYFDRSILGNPNPVTLYYLEGDQGNLSLDRLKAVADSNSQALQYRPTDTVYLLPKGKLWFYLEQDGTPLEIVDAGKVTGISVNEIQTTAEGMLVINFNKKATKRVSAKDPIQALGVNQTKSPSEPLNVTIKLQRQQ